MPCGTWRYGALNIVHDMWCMPHGTHLRRFLCCSPPLRRCAPSGMHHMQSSAVLCCLLCVKHVCRRVSRHIDRHVYTHVYRHGYRNMSIHMYRHVCGHVYRHVHRNVYRNVYRHVYRHVHRHLYRHACVPSLCCRQSLASAANGTFQFSANY